MLKNVILSDTKKLKADFLWFEKFQLSNLFEPSSVHSALFQIIAP